MPAPPKLYRKIAVGSLAAEGAANWRTSQTIPAEALAGEGAGAQPIYSEALGQVGGFLIGAVWLNNGVFVDDTANITLEVYFTMKPKTATGEAVSGMPTSIVFSGGQKTIKPAQAPADYVDLAPGVAAVRVVSSTAPGAATHLALIVQEHGRS